MTKEPKTWIQFNSSVSGRKETVRLSGGPGIIAYQASSPWEPTFECFPGTASNRCALRAWPEEEFPPPSVHKHPTFF